MRSREKVIGVKRGCRAAAVVTVNILSTGELPEGANVYRTKGARRQTGRCATVELHRTRIAACRIYHEYERGALPRSDGP